MVDSRLDLKPNSSSAEAPLYIHTAVPHSAKRGSHTPFSNSIYLFFYVPTPSRLTLQQNLDIIYSD